MDRLRLPSHLLLAVRGTPHEHINLTGVLVLPISDQVYEVGAPL